jgi:hypothetical protein
MFAGILIVAFSSALLVYWFRYSCLMVMRNFLETMAPAEEDGRFHIGEVQAQLRSGTDLGRLHTSLERDYTVLVYLVEHAAGLELQTIEDRLLVLDYKVMRWWYRLTRIAAPEQAREALSEMASVLSILAGKMSERAGVRDET